MEATIILEYGEKKIAKAIADAVSPDNNETPSGLTIKTVRKGNYVLTKVRTEKKLETFIATIDDLLFCVSTAETTLCEATKY